MAISVGDAILKLGVDTRDLDRGMQSLGNRIKQHHKAIGLAMTVMGGAILAAGVLSVKTYAAMGDEVQKMALRTGFSTEALSELRHAAQISGADLSTLEKAVKRMSGTILDAQDGLETYIRAFEHIGIEVQELDSLNPEEQFLRIAEAIAEVEDPTKRAAIAQDIFGRAGTALLPMFAAGKEGLADLREEAHKLGIVFDQEAAEKAAEMTDAMTRMKESVSGVKMAIAEHLIPILLPLIEQLKDIIVRVKDWAKEHPKLTEAIIKFAGVMAVLMVIGGPMLIFAPTIKAIIVASKALVTFILTRLIPVIVALSTALWAKVAALYAVLIAMGPVGWGLAAATMAFMTTALIFIHRKHTEELQRVERATRRLTETNQQATEQQKIMVETTGEMIGQQQTLIKQADKQVEALRKVTQGYSAQATAVSSVRREVEAYFRSMKVAAPERRIVSAEERRYMSGRMSEFRRLAASAAAAGETAQASYYAQLAAGISTQLQKFEFGGIAMRPMIASIAEKQPEAVIPLDKLGGMLGGKVNIFIELDGRVLAKALGEPLVDDMRLRLGSRF